MFHPVPVGKRTRYSYAKIKEVMEMPHLLDIQRKSYEWFIGDWENNTKGEGLMEIFQDISPISDFQGKVSLSLLDYELGEPKYSLDESKERDATYAAPLRVKVRLLDRTTGIFQDSEVFMGDFPLMTASGTFIINGAERVIVSQLVRSPGAYYGVTVDQSGKSLFNSTVIPNRGAWIELETDANDVISVRIDRTRKLPVTVFLRALNYINEQEKLRQAELATDGVSTMQGRNDDHLRVGLTNLVFGSSEEILALFDNDDAIRATLERDNTNTGAEALEEIYRRIRPGEPFNVDNAHQMLRSLFFDAKRYDLATVGRYKLTKKLGWKRRIQGQILAEPLTDKETGEIIVPADVLLDADMLEDITIEQEHAIFGEGNAIIINVKRSDEGETLQMICSPTLEYRQRTISINDILASISYLLNMMHGIGRKDDIDHLGNRRVRSVGELLQNQFRIGLSRMERVVKERMSMQEDVSNPSNLINIRPVVAAIKEFFGSSQLSQFMDQHNPLAELTHKRRLSALGPGGLSRERAGFEVRDVHNSHYGRMCPIETPEGPNIGLIGSLSNYARINRFGFMETPYRRVDKVNKRVTDEVKYITADEEDSLIIAQANEPLDDNDWFVNERVVARIHEETTEVRREKVDYMDVSPKQVVSIATAMIPFLENDDANRALMGANMQRQAVPLLRTQAPLVGTGMEYKAACDSGVMILAKRPGVVETVTADNIVVRTADGQRDEYKLQKFLRSNQGTCINQLPIVFKGDEVEAMQPIADGPSTDHGELALGYNIIVAYMPWEGYNYEDAILLSENLIKRDIYTSIHIEEYDCEARDTKLGPEEITRDIPNVSDDSLKDLDEMGIIRKGAEVRTGDILVGKVTPKGETELSAEERLLRAIFGEKAREVRDTSLRVPHGEAGRIVDVKIYSRENNDELNPGVNQMIRVYIAQKRKISVGDKMSGRHGNKGVVSRIMREEDMPFLPDGTPVDIVLNPLGVPSRMNIGQILETHLGMAIRNLGTQIKQGDPTVEERLRAIGYDFDQYGMPKPDVAGIHIATPVFDGARENDVFDTIRASGMDPTAKTVLYDGRTGEPFKNKVTVGCVYMLKLHHLVDDKIHARSVGPYSLVTQQPLGGKAQFGGQRFGEMEVWALEAYGAAYTLQEILTVKSDDVVGRVKTYESIVKGENIPEPGVPESFKVLIKELQSIGLDIKVQDENANEIMVQDDDDEDINIKDVVRDADMNDVDDSGRAGDRDDYSSDYDDDAQPDEDDDSFDGDIIADIGGDDFDEGAADDDDMDMFLSDDDTEE
ncbi:DNA-directed RNA polymerase subunit beta [Anaerovibrio sp.]|uniref:DNA-directed RNA polymerase subunit beta n=1 Tax=Anaerovibrio sp. TaxID=1872532 RepID=UPI003F169CD5